MARKRVLADWSREDLVGEVEILSEERDAARVALVACGGRCARLKALAAKRRRQMVRHLRDREEDRDRLAVAAGAADVGRLFLLLLPRGFRAWESFEDGRRLCHVETGAVQFTGPNPWQALRRATEGELVKHCHAAGHVGARQLPTDCFASSPNRPDGLSWECKRCASRRVLARRRALAVGKTRAAAAVIVAAGRRGKAPVVRTVKRQS